MSREAGNTRQSDHRHQVPVLEIGGTHVTSAMVELAAGRVTPGAGSRQPLQGDASARELLDQILRCATELDATPGAAWGVAVPGPFDYQHGVARFEGVGKFDALNGVDIGQVLHRELPSSPSSIRFVNDAAAFTIGEWAYGAAAGHDRVVGITLGTGVGSGFLAGGVPIGTGPNVPPCGEVFRLTFNSRPLEDTVSRRALLRNYAQRAPHGHDLDVVDIAARARAGDQIADQVLGHAFTQLGTVLTPWLARFQATAMVVGGSMSRSWDLVYPPLFAGILASDRSIAQGLELMPAQNPEEAGLLGAAWHGAR